MTPGQTLLLILAVALLVMAAGGALFDRLFPDEARDAWERHHGRRVPR